MSASLSSPSLVSFDLRHSSAWQRLSELARRDKESGISLRERFAADPDRFARFSCRSMGLLLDYSKQRLSEEVLAALAQLWFEANVPGWITRMRSGDILNTSEQRAVLHVALREPQPRPEVAAVLEKMRSFCADIHEHRWRGATGQPIRDIVNIGIGGSDLGPRMAASALTAFHQPDLCVHFVSNLDAAHLLTTLTPLDPETTLFIVASKSFTTRETMVNARAARGWLTGTLGEAAVARHFVAISTNLPAVSEFGIDTESCFEFWDWVGGRFSVWSAIGLPLMLAVGYENFLQFLAGGHAVDQHFFEAPVTGNLPALMALLGIWNIDFLGAETLAVLPYSQLLEYLPSYLQQLDMESNGKQLTREGQPVACATAPVLWGEAGTNGQHAFFQLIHQGGRLIPCDFIAFQETDYDLPGRQAAVLANCLAQSEAMMLGKTLEEARREMQAAGISAATIDQLAPFKVFPGNQPSTTLLLPGLTPYTLGQLLALYEHKVFVQGILWGINSFDQWGVEYGKQLADRLLPLLEGQPEDATPEFAGLNSSTAGLIRWLRQKR